MAENDTPQPAAQESATDTEAIRQLTWAALLARWMAFAKTSAALPDDAEGQRWKGSVVSIITLQAVTCALGELDGLPADEQALGLDRAEILIRAHREKLADLWQWTDIPPNLADLLMDSAAALKAAKTAWEAGSGR
ncbi:MAG: hypothetical protein D8M59_10225 [Planctomycetes bacterium]|nr:hypothetical protein [Planctomycetota bacterium]NOG55219.1 hypothetical protein [Planctomycetota bacterium]